jgi:hypothetical protein
MKSIEATLEIQNTPTDKTNELLTTVRPLLFYCEQI